jgi:hypothetical protein
MKHIICINQHGEVRSILDTSSESNWKKIFPSSDLRIERAGYIYYCNESKAWFVRIFNNSKTVLGPFETQQAATEAEVDYVYSMIKESVENVKISDCPFD